MGSTAETLKWCPGILLGSLDSDVTERCFLGIRYICGTDDAPEASLRCCFQDGFGKTLETVSQRYVGFLLKAQTELVFDLKINKTTSNMDSVNTPFMCAVEHSSALLRKVLT